MPRKKLIYFALIAIFLVDTGYSFWQHTTQPLDGDMAVIILPSKEYSEVMENPFGQKVLNEDAKYVGPNRFFVHFFMHHYFRTAPRVLRSFLDPIDAIFVACGLLKLFCQLAIVFLIARFIRRSQGIDKTEWVAAAVILMSLFQTNGFYAGMGIIDRAITYVCFYALPTTLLLFFLLPFLESFYHREKEVKLSWFQHVAFIPAIIILPFSGPLNLGVIMIFGALILTHYGIKAFRTGGRKNCIPRFIDSLPGACYIYLLPLGLLCLYSLYIGRNNLENFTSTLPLIERYVRLPIGLGKLLTVKIGLPLLLLGIGVNFLLIRRYIPTKLPNHQRALGWCFIFSVIYVLLVPLGGFRNYREFIIRYDVFIPVTLLLIYLFTATSITLWQSLDVQLKKRFYYYLGAFVFLFFLADRPQTRDYRCQKQALLEISEAESSPVAIESNCLLLSWQRVTNSEGNRYYSKLLQLWGITEEEIAYYNKE